MLGLLVWWWQLHFYGASQEEPVYWALVSSVIRRRKKASLKRSEKITAHWKKSLLGTHPRNTGRTECGDAADLRGRFSGSSNTADAKQSGTTAARAKSFRPAVLPGAQDGGGGMWVQF